MASYGARWAEGEGRRAIAGQGAPRLALGLGAGLLVAPWFAGHAAGVRAPFAATLLALGVTARAFARFRRGGEFGARGLALALPAPALVALASCAAGEAQGVALALPLALPLFGLAAAIEWLEQPLRWRGKVRGLLGGAVTLALLAFWGHFWVADLSQARARVVIAPAQGLATAAAAFALLSSGTLRVSPGRMALGGGALGLGLAYALLAARAEAVGCVGVSPAYEAALLATAVLLYGVGPLVADAP